ncbi:MAG: mannosyltransferase [Flavisolibacter sp.]|nr:mannosyltransferase [Flavisolibacter sp.]
MKRCLHIVCFDVPYPVSHGGFFDIFYKLQALKKEGIAIILHCFMYGRSQQPELEKWCNKVYYYTRKTGIRGFSSFLPYIVASRKNNELIKRLSADDHPILLEGTHTTYILFKNLFPGRTILYRLHNIEHIYYRQLYQWERYVVKKVYYGWESVLLQQYEKKAAIHASMVLTVSEQDGAHFHRYCPAAKIDYLPLFLKFENIESKTGVGTYALYHGNLSINENEQAVLWLLQAVAPTGMAFIIAGREPSKRIKAAVGKCHWAQLVINPTDAALKDLIVNAHINLIYSFNATGIKLKLIHALFAGRHCIINTAAMCHAEIDACCYIADEPVVLQQMMERLKDIYFTKDEIEQRRAVLLKHFNNKINAERLIQYLP